MINLDLQIKLKIKNYLFNMETMINIFAVIGVFATVVALYHFGVDQYALWEMRMKEKYGK